MNKIPCFWSFLKNLAALINLQFIFVLNCIIELKYPIYDNKKVFAIVILPGRLNLNLDQSCIWLLILPTTLLKFISDIFWLILTTYPRMVIDETTIKPRCKISSLRESGQFIGEIWVFSALISSPESFLKSSNVNFAFAILSAVPLNRMVTSSAKEESESPLG